MAEFLTGQNGGARRLRELLAMSEPVLAPGALELALPRARRYAEAGADVLFVEAPRRLPNCTDR